MLLKLDISENGEEESVNCEKLDMSEKPDRPDRVDPIESVDIWDIREGPRPMRPRKSSKPCGKAGGGKNPPMSPVIPVEKDCLTEEEDVEFFFTDITDPSGSCWMQDSLTSSASVDSARLNFPSGSSSTFESLVVASRLAA